MPLDRTWLNSLVDDDGTNTVGTVWDKAAVGHIYTDVDAALASGSGLTPLVCEGRVTAVSGAPVADVSGATALYFTPNGGNRIALYTLAAGWKLYTFTELVFPIGTVTGAIGHDLFAYVNAGGAVALERVAWASATTRAVAIVAQDGVWVKAGDPTRRLVAAFYAVTTSTTDDSVLKRCIWNAAPAQQVPRVLRVFEPAAGWPYTVATMRQANNNPANQVAVFVGVAGPPTLQLEARSMCANASAAYVQIGIGEDSTSAIHPFCLGGVGGTHGTSSFYMVTGASLVLAPPVGYHTYANLEGSSAAGVTNWYGTTAMVSAAARSMTGLQGTMRM